MFYENFRGCLSDIYQNQDKTKNEKQEKQPQQNNEGQDTKETFKEIKAPYLSHIKFPLTYMIPDSSLC